MATIANLSIIDATEQNRFTREQEQLLDLMRRKPTLRVVRAPEIKNVIEWESEHPEHWLLIEITQDDIHGDCFGKLVATAENAIEFRDLKQELSQTGINTFTTHGVSPHTADTPAVVTTFAVVGESI